MSQESELKSQAEMRGCARIAGIADFPKYSFYAILKYENGGWTVVHYPTQEDWVEAIRAFPYAIPVVINPATVDTVVAVKPEMPRQSGP